MTDFGFARHSYVLDARMASRRAQDMAGDGPAVVLLSRACDSELDAVGRLLASANVPHLRLDADHCHNDNLFLDPVTGLVSLGGRTVAPTVTWIRHFAATAISRRGEAVTDRFTAESWLAVARTLASLSAVTITAGRPSVAAQMRVATRLGIVVPQTVMTNDLSRAGRVIRSPRLVLKAAHQHFVEAEPGLLSGVFPAVVERGPLAGPGVPVIVQAYVEHDAELRVYHVDGELVCFEVGKSAPADPWLAPDRVSARLVPAPPGVAAAVRRLAAAMSLRLAAFDFLVSGDDAVFLEANPDGDWRWLEAKAGQSPVTAAAGRMLSRLHQAAGGGSEAFNLLAFLSGGM